jgi:hypothetical protein
VFLLLNALSTSLNTAVLGMHPDVHKLDMTNPLCEFFSALVPSILILFLCVFVCLSVIIRVVYIQLGSRDNEVLDSIHHSLSSALCAYGVCARVCGLTLCSFGCDC